MKTLLSLVGSLILWSAHAQTHSIGLEAGPTFAQTVRKDIDYYKTLNAGFANLFYEYKHKVFTSSFGIGYLNKGFLQELIYVNEQGEILGEGAIERVRHNYLSVSEIVGVEFGEKYIGFSGVGVRAAVYSNTIVSSPAFLLNDGTTLQAYRWELDYLNLIDVSALARVGAGIRTENGNIFYLSGMYDFGLTKVYESETPSTHRNLTILVGFKQKIETPQRKGGLFRK